MRPSRFTEDQVRQALAQVDGGTPLVAVCRTLGITQTTFYRWRTKYGGTEIAAPPAVRELREQNVKLKQLVADLYLERQALRESLAKRAKR
ncbi:MAG: transposase family protein [Gemmatimonadetes bacterium]|nr:transposase family protein [Gemmatimonadota bacterium]